MKQNFHWQMNHGLIKNSVDTVFITIAATTVALIVVDEGLLMMVLLILMKK